MKKYIPFFGCMMTTKYPWFEAAVRRTVARVGLELEEGLGVHRQIGRVGGEG